MNQEDALRRADRVLDRITTRTAYLIAQTRRALRELLADTPGDDDPFDFYRALELSTEPAFQPDILDLERFVEAWGHAVPTEPEIRAGLAHHLGERFQFVRADVPDLRAVLGLDTDAVQSAYMNLFSGPLDGIYAAQTATDRHEWADLIPGVDNDAIVALESEVDWITLDWGEELFAQGSPGENMYVLVNGRLRVVRTNPDGSEHVLGEVGQGAIVGEIALLTDEARTATVFAVRDSELIRLTRAGLERITERFPAAMLRITRQMVRRVTADLRPVQRESRVRNIAVIPCSEDAPVEAFTARLAEMLSAMGPTLHLDKPGFGRRQGEAVPEGVQTLRQISWLEQQEASHRFVIYEGEADDGPWTRLCLSHADRILLVGVGGGSPALGTAEHLLSTPEMQRIATGRELALIHPSREAQPQGTLAWLAARPGLLRHHHVALNDDPSMGRLARFLAGEAVGVALGGGGARGLAHLGVLRAMEEANIPIDAIGGVSFGAIVAAAYAAGHSVDELTAMFRQLSKGARSLADFTVPILSLLTGRRINRLLRQSVGGDVHLEDLWLPTFAVSANLNQGGPRVHRQGEAWRAVRASLSIPVLFPPVLYEGELHTDGGAFTNMPADIMLSVLGRGTVIGSSVTPKDEITERYAFGDEVSGLQLLVNRMRRRQPSLKTPGAIDVLVWAMGLSNSYLRPAQDAAADLLLDLPVHHYDLFAFDAFDDLVEAGYNTAREQLGTWWQSR